MDWYQLWEIVSKPDNIPILMLMVLVPFYLWYGMRQAFANDRLITQLEADKALAKTHHRKVQPHEKGWERTVHVWPHLLKIEFLVAIIVSVILFAWSILLDAPLEEPANPNLTMNPSKAPWYFLGLQEMLVYFDPWIAGVVMPGLIVGGLMAIPYCDVSPFGNGYYTFKQRRYALCVFFFGFLALWCLLIIIGVFIRGPGWMWFWPGQTWDHHRIANETFRHLPHLVGLHEKTEPFMTAVFGFVVLAAYFSLSFFVVHKIYTKRKPIEYQKMNIFQYGTMQLLLAVMLALPIKMVLWHAFKIKYVLILPWLNI